MGVFGSSFIDLAEATVIWGTYSGRKMSISGTLNAEPDALHPRPVAYLTYFEDNKRIKILLSCKNVSNNIKT